MVGALRATRWLLGSYSALLRDVQGWWSAARTRLPIAMGLFTYRVRLPGGSRRIHLQIRGDGSGVLMVDATDAVHLNPSAAMLAKFALDGRSQNQAAQALKNIFSGAGSQEVRGHVGQMYDLVDHLKTSTDTCITCDLDAQRAPLFSVPITAPYKADLALTYGCNNACRHCYNRVKSSAGTKSKPEGFLLSQKQWKKVLRKLAGVGIPHVIFTGGEPTLFPGLFELIRHAERLGLITGMNTNGRRLADRDFTNSLVRAGLSHVQITLESCRAEIHNAVTGADSFQETCQGITIALAAGLHVITNTTLTRLNVDHALETVDFLNRLGLRIFAMNGMIFSGRGLSCGDEAPIEKMPCILSAVRDRAIQLGMRFLWYTPTEYCRLSPVELDLGPRRCNAGEYSMCIEPDGDVLPCQSYYAAAGNILRDPWPAIWDSDLFRCFRRRVGEPQACGLPERCWRCPDLPLWAGGCRLEREKAGDGQWAVDGGQWTDGKLQIV